ncbi:GtrA family protein [Streptoverticillium reticulum]|uniref:GtrA family protein n=1 Tax=Streptoverticillium reticulum TaxID=1433415 RepID=UPI0039BFD017
MSEPSGAPADGAPPAGAERRRLPPPVRFVIVGGTAYLVYCALYLLLRTSLGCLRAHVTAFCLNLVVTYLLHCRFTYHVQPHGQGFVRFTAGSGVSLVLSSALAWSGVRLLGTPPSVTPELAVIITMPLTFLIHRHAVTVRRTAPRPLPDT